MSFLSNPTREAISTTNQMRVVTMFIMLGVFFFAAYKHYQGHHKEASEKVTTVVTDKNEVKTIAKDQTPDEFTQKSMSLKAGKYVFNIANKNVAHAIGFVLAPKGRTDKANHIEAAYVTAPVPTGGSSKKQMN